MHLALADKILISKPGKPFSTWASNTNKLETTSFGYYSDFEIKSKNEEGILIHAYRNGKKTRSYETNSLRADSTGVLLSHNNIVLKWWDKMELQIYPKIRKVDWDDICYYYSGNKPMIKFQPKGVAFDLFEGVSRLCYKDSSGTQLFSKKTKLQKETYYNEKGAVWSESTIEICKNKLPISNPDERINIKGCWYLRFE